MKAPRRWTRTASPLLTLTSAWMLGTPFAAAAEPGLITSVPSPPLLALVAPKGPPVRATAHAGRAGALFLEWGTSAWVKKEQAKRFGIAADEGLALARQAGQRGVLLQVRYTETRNFFGSTVVSPVGDGVLVVGAGPDANATCYLQNCEHSLQPMPDINAARKWTTDSGYYWLELGPEIPGGKPSRATGVPVAISRYDTEALQSRTLQVKLAEDAGYAYAQSVNASVLEDMLTALKEDAATREDAAAVQALRAAQKTLRDQQVRIESALEQELKRQAERSQNTGALAFLGDAANLAGAALTSDPNAQTQAEQRMASLSQELGGLRKQLGDIHGKVQSLAQKYKKSVPRLLYVVPPPSWGMHPGSGQGHLPVPIKRPR